MSVVGVSGAESATAGSEDESEELDGSLVAVSAAAGLAIAVPIPSNTANAPTRPMYFA